MEIQKVSDPSQKYKIGLFLLFFVAVVAGYFDLRGLLAEKVEKEDLGFSEVTSKTTSSTLAIIGTSSTLITATSTGPHFICNTGLNDAYIRFASSVSTSTKPGSTDSNGMLFTTSTLPNNCAGPFDYNGVHAGHTKTGTTSIVITTFE